MKPSLFISISHGNAVEYKRINENATIRDYVNLTSTLIVLYRYLYVGNSEYLLLASIW